jgi:hypothetical protein
MVLLSGRGCMRSPCVGIFLDVGVWPPKLGSPARPTIELSGPLFRLIQVVFVCVLLHDLRHVVICLSQRCLVQAFDGSPGAQVCRSTNAAACLAIPEVSQSQGQVLGAAFGCRNTTPERCTMKLVIACPVGVPSVGPGSLRAVQVRRR